MSPPAAGHSRRSRRSSVSAAHMATAGSKDAFSTPAPASVQRGKETPAGTTEAATVVVKPADSKRETLVSPGGAVRAAIHARRRGARDVDMERAAAVAGAGKRAHDANEKDKVLQPPSGTRSPAPGESISRRPDRTIRASTAGRARRLSSAASRARTPPARPRPCAAASSSASPTRPSGTFAPNLRRRRGCAWSKPWINPRDCWDARVARKTAGRRIRCRTRAARTRCCRTWATRLTCTSGSGSFARRTNQPPAFRPTSPRKPGKRSKAAKKPAHGLSLPAPGDDSTQMDDGDEMEHDMDDEKKEKGTFHLDRRRLWELQARFTRAVAEIEFLGVGKPVKRRKVEYMQRTAFPLDKLLGGDD